MPARLAEMTPLKILFAVQHFRQGWGGAPESVRLMANQLSAIGVTSDVFDLGRIRRDVGRLDVLPEIGSVAAPFPYDEMADYSAILLTGPWQNALSIGRLLAHRTKGQKIYYLPRGGLGQVEFSRARDLKKVPYLSLIERRFIDAASGVIYSSNAEQRETVKAARGRGEEHIIPDFVAPTAPPSHAQAPDVDQVTFAFLAEISPRKGLHLLVDAFVAWVSARGLGDRVRLVVGGAPRPGCEAYLEEIQAIHRPHADHVKIEFRGAVHHGQRGAFYTETDVMVIASSFESFGLTVIEALNEGCIVVSTPNVGALEYIPAADGVVRAQAFDTAEMVKSLDHAMTIALDWKRQRRGQQQAFSRAAVTAINARALASWAKLLSIQGAE